MKMMMSNGLVHIALPISIIAEYPLLCELPDGVCVEGGAARSITRRLITSEKEQIRDVDLVCVDDKVDEATLEKLALEYMADDYSHGHGIQTVDVADYFRSRDFTINEVLVTASEVICTPAAFRAYKLGLIKASANEDVRSRQQVKAIYLWATLTDATHRKHTISEELMLDIDELRLFDVALFLNKAMQRGKAVANSFVNKLIETAGWEKPLSIVEFANWLHYETYFDFRSDKKVKANDTPKYRISSNSSVLRKALDEYFDMEEELVSPNEFTAEEWDLCNN